MLPGICQETTKLRSLFALAGGFRHPVELDDLPLLSLCETLQGFFLDVERKTLSLLLTAGNTRQRYETFHGSHSPR